MDLTSKEFSDKVAEQQKENPDFTKFKKTGNTKVILTYNCEEFQYTSDKMSMTMWLTNDVENVFKNFSSGLGNAPGGFQMPAGMTGQMMAMHQVDNEKNIVVDLEVTEINRNETTELSTEGFDFK
jgi:Domain of unknown function (DUF4412)